MLVGIAYGQEQQPRYIAANGFKQNAQSLGYKLSAHTSSQVSLELYRRIKTEAMAYRWSLPQQRDELLGTTPICMLYRKLLWIGLGLLLAVGLIWWGYHFWKKAQYFKKMATRQTYQFEFIQSARKEERTRIGGELHDNLVPVLFYVSSSLENIQQQVTGVAEAKLTKTRVMLDQARIMVRDISHQLTSNVYSADGLQASLHELKQAVELSDQITLHLVLVGLEHEPPLSWGIFIHQTCTELVFHALKHAQATEIQVSVQWQKEAVVIRMKSNGIVLSDTYTDPGIELDHVTRVAKAMGGHLEVAHGSGFSVIMQIPNQPIDTYADKSWYS